MATLGRRLAAVAHRLAGHPLDTQHPAIRDVLRGIRRSRGTTQRRVVGFAAALRRSELVASQVVDVALGPEDTVLKGKRDEELYVLPTQSQLSLPFQRHPNFPEKDGVLGK